MGEKDSTDLVRQNETEKIMMDGGCDGDGQKDARCVGRREQKRGRVRMTGRTHH